MKKILIQLDTDPQPSVFDRVVAVDAGVDEIFSYGGVNPENVTELVHGAMFTRSPHDLKYTAIFVGGSDVKAGEALLHKVQSLYFGPIRVSALLDSNGSNTTAAAAVRTAARHLELGGSRAVVLGGTGPVGHRVAEILASRDVEVTVTSRTLERARETCEIIHEKHPKARLIPAVPHGGDFSGLMDGCQILVAAGAASVQFLKEEQWDSIPSLRVAIDLNAVPPTGLEGIGVTDKAKERGHVACYGAIGVGGTKMKVHRAAVEALFEQNDHILNTAEVFAIAERIG
ncbi:MAG: bifunctional NADP-dependent methylenetetrahydromethanopterin dehydrogenase/methylenetetrahydrofolate dehydrogenase [Planctomycetota bacterium]|nr:MAG: bifunctional NADP-dependent methylenetetrahydromethanopterin dehydrogenase/methylenetetrahydrofolate dehydrogenase [Planctomycetota bacterium]